MITPQQIDLAVHTLENSQIFSLDFFKKFHDFSRFDSCYFVLQHR